MAIKAQDTRKRLPRPSAPPPAKSGLTPHFLPMRGIYAPLVAQNEPADPFQVGLGQTDHEGFPKAISANTGR
jgi:hypothetical protein